MKENYKTAARILRESIKPPQASVPEVPEDKANKPTEEQSNEPRGE